jgi:hypothetical protein
LQAAFCLAYDKAGEGLARKTLPVQFPATALGRNLIAVDLHEPNAGPATHASLRHADRAKQVGRSGPPPHAAARAPRLTTRLAYCARCFPPLPPISADTGRLAAVGNLV